LVRRPGPFGPAPRAAIVGREVSGGESRMMTPLEGEFLNRPSERALAARNALFRPAC